MLDFVFLLRNLILYMKILEAFKKLSRLCTFENVIMLHKTRGIVFKTIKFSESSVVCKIYTERFGMQSYIVSGVRSSKSKMKASVLQAFSLLDMEVYYRENRNLNRIKEFRPAVVFSSLPFDIVKAATGLFMIEILYKSIREEEPNAALFNFIFEKIKELDEAVRISADFLLKFLLELSGLLGFFPNGTYSDQTPQFDLKEGSFVGQANQPQYLLDEIASQFLSDLIRNHPMSLSHSNRKKMLEGLLQYYQLHVPNFSHPKSLRVLEEIFR